MHCGPMRGEQGGKLGGRERLCVIAPSFQSIWSCSKIESVFKVWNVVGVGVCSWRRGAVLP